MITSDFIKKVRAIIIIILSQILFYLLALKSSYILINPRLPNQKRKRDHFEEMISDLNEKDFILATGLSRPMFKYLLNILNNNIKFNDPCNKQAINSSGSPITLTCKLYIHQRLCKGADVKEFFMYSVDTKHVWDYVWLPIATCLNENVNNINFYPEDSEWLELQSRYYFLIILFYLIIIINYYN
jgi:hypothetical protein